MIKPHLLRKISYFAKLEPGNPALVELARATLEEEYAKGQILFLENDPCKGLFFLEDGQIRIYKSGPDGREQTMLLIGSGASFNEVAALDGGLSPASAEALEMSRVWIVPTAAMQQIIEQESQVSREIIRIFAARLRHLTMLVGEISLKQVTARVARILISQGSQEAILGTGISDQVITQMTQQQMASMVGTVREMIGRALRTLDKAGAIKARRGYIEIKDHQKLKEFLT